MTDWWVPYASGVTAILAVIIAIFSKTPVVPRSRLNDLTNHINLLQKRIEEQSRQIDRQANEISILTGKLAARDARIDALLDECEHWREKFLDLDGRMRRPRPPRT